MLIEQAVFTSACNALRQGYQLVAQSPGIEDDEARLLTLWGPSHDSLLADAEGSTSVNYFPLSDGRYCISQTTADGDEYSGRGGSRIYTQYLVAPAEIFRRFANNPFALVRAARAKGALRVINGASSNLVPFQLAGRGAIVDEGLVAGAVEQWGIEKITELLAAVASGRPVGVGATGKIDVVTATIVNLLPLECRAELSFSTGLRWSAQRSLRLFATGSDATRQRQLARQAGAVCVDLHAPGPVAERGWAAYISLLLHEDRLCELVELLATERAGLTLATLDDFGEALLHGVDPYLSEAEDFVDPLDRSVGEVGRTLRQDGAPRADGFVPPPYSEPGGDVSTGVSAESDFDFATELQPAVSTPLPTSRDQAEPLPASLTPAVQRLLAATTGLQTPLTPPGATLPMEQSPEVVECLERLDDVVFESIGGNQQALAELIQLWPATVAKLGPEQIAESREQYLRYSLTIWDAYLRQGMREPARAIAALEVLCLMFSE